MMPSDKAAAMASSSAGKSKNQIHAGKKPGKNKVKKGGSNKRKASEENDTNGDAKKRKLVTKEEKVTASTSAESKEGQTPAGKLITLDFYLVRKL